MGKVVVSEFMSLDGVIEDPGGAEDYQHGGWSFRFDRGEEGNRFKLDELMAADAQLLGRVTYEGFARAWPSMTGNEFAEKMNAMPKYVVSAGLNDEAATWNNTSVIREDLASHVARLKGEISGDLLVAGSARLVQSLAREDLVDEYRLMVFPIVLGSGKRLFDASPAPVTLQLIESRALGPQGVVLLTYAPSRSVAGEEG